MYYESQDQDGVLLVRLHCLWRRGVVVGLHVGGVDAAGWPRCSDRRDFSEQTMSDEAAVLWRIVAMSCTSSWLQRMRTLRKPAILWLMWANSSGVCWISWTISVQRFCPARPGMTSCGLCRAAATQSWRWVARRRACTVAEPSLTKKQWKMRQDACGSSETATRAVVDLTVHAGCECSHQDRRATAQARKDSRYRS